MTYISSFRLFSVNDKGLLPLIPFLVPIKVINNSYQERIFYRQ